MTQDHRWKGVSLYSRCDSKGQSLQETAVLRYVPRRGGGGVSRGWGWGDRALRGTEKGQLSVSYSSFQSTGR